LQFIRALASSTLYSASINTQYRFGNEKKKHPVFYFLPVATVALFSHARAFLLRLRVSHQRVRQLISLLLGEHYGKLSLALVSDFFLQPGGERLEARRTQRGGLAQTISPGGAAQNSCLGLYTSSNISCFSSCLLTRQKNTAVLFSTNRSRMKLPSSGIPIVDRRTASSSVASFAAA
jgi:hypothetical protein